MSGSDNTIPDRVKISLRERARVLAENQPFSIPLDSYELELFEWYFYETEKTISEMHSRALAYFTEEIAASSHVDERGILEADYYVKRTRYSHVIYLTSLLETFLDQDCVRLADVLGQEHLYFAVKELKGDQWSIRRKFLERHGKFQIADNDWDGPLTLIRLRNNIVHSNGSTSELSDSDRKRLKAEPGILLNGPEIVVAPEYIRNAIETVRRLIQVVNANLAAHVGRAIRPTVVKPKAG